MPATDTLLVHLFGRPVARLTRSGPLDYRLEYLADWLAAQDAVPVSLSLPLATTVHRGPVVAAFFDNLLPDDDRVRARWAAEAGLGSAEPFLLLAEFGHDVAGALEFTHDDDAPTTDRILQPLTEAEVGGRIAALRADTSAWVQARDDAGRFSLGGAQAKFALMRSGQQWVDPSGAAPSTHIFKPLIDRVPDGEVVEFVMMRAASALGIETASVQLPRFAGERTLLVERFDRAVDAAGGVIRLHQEDALQALGVPRLQKYEHHGGPGYRDLIRLLDRAWPEESAASRWTLALGLAFSWIVLNTDGHAKNFTVMIEPDSIRLAPLYDISSYIPYVRGDGLRAWRRAFADVELSMAVLGYRRAGDLTSEAWRTVARDARLEPGELLTWIADACDRIPDLVQTTIRELDPEDRSPVLDKLNRRIRVRAEQAARALAR